MLGRNNRILDIQIVRSAVQTAQFFASTLLLVVAGLLTVLGASDAAIQVVEDLPFAEVTSRTLWEIKVLALATVFVYAFFKFMWSIRQYSYCAVLIGGAAPLDRLPADSEQAADDISWVATLAAKHSNQVKSDSCWINLPEAFPPRALFGVRCGHRTRCRVPL